MGQIFDLDFSGLVTRFLSHMLFFSTLTFDFERAVRRSIEMSHTYYAYDIAEYVTENKTADVPLEKVHFSLSIQGDIKDSANNSIEQNYYAESEFLPILKKYGKNEL